MESKFNTFLVLIGTLIVAAQNTQAAPKTNGKLLKFYAITKQEYNSILRFANEQPAISEARIIESHSSLADWSNSLHQSWNNLFNYTQPGNNQAINGYPICVIKSDDSTVRRGRGARQYDDEYNYSGMAPNVIYTGSSDYPHYDGPDNGRPDYVRPHHHGQHDADEPIPTEAKPDTKAPTVNCMVVVNRRKPQTTVRHTEEEEEEAHTRPPHDYLHYPHFPHYPHYAQYPHYLQYPYYPYPLPHHPPHGQYPYRPPPPYGYPPHYGHEHKPESRSSDIQVEYPDIDPAAEAHYQKMLSEYYNHLYGLYMADVSTQLDRQDDVDSIAQQSNDEEEAIQYDDDSERAQDDETGVVENDFKLLYV